MQQSPPSDPEQATKLALKILAFRHRTLSEEIAVLDDVIAELCASVNPALLGAYGIEPEVAATLLVVAGDNPERMHNERAFAALCGTSPLEASSGQITRHRLNRGGNRQANNALWRIVMVRMSSDPTTDEGSMLTPYRKAIALRRQHLRADEGITLLDRGPDVLAFQRDSGIACFTNFSSTPIQQPPGRVLLSSATTVESAADVSLPPDTTVWMTP